MAEIIRTSAAHQGGTQKMRVRMRFRIAVNGVSMCIGNGRGFKRGTRQFRVAKPFLQRGSKQRSVCGQYERQCGRERKNRVLQRLVGNSRANVEYQWIQSNGR